MSNSCRQLEAIGEQASVRFHLSLNVADLDRSSAFFHAFFGRDPVKSRSDYVKFEIDKPPLVLSLAPHRTSPGGNLNHLGFCLSDSAAVVEWQRRLEMAGIRTVREDGVECCYARQTKFWVHDPDGNMWEVYTVEDEIEHRGGGGLACITNPQQASDRTGPALADWHHHLGASFPARLPILDATVDRVLLEGTFNEALSAGEQAHRLAEIYRILKPGGFVSLHVLTANQNLADEPWRLPGPAAQVSAVPTGQALLQQFAAAGFQESRLAFHAAAACFHAAGAELREARLEASKLGDVSVDEQS